MTSQTMTVMARTAKTLSRRTANTSDIDDMMIAAGEMHEDARELGMAMGATDSSIDDEELLSKLTAATAEISKPVLTIPDEEVEAYLESALLDLTLPKVPNSTAQHTPPPPAYSNVHPII